MTTFYETSRLRSCAMKVNGTLFHILLSGFGSGPARKASIVFIHYIFTFGFVHSNNNDWRNKRGKKKKTKAEYETSIFKSGKSALKKKIKSVAYVKKQKYHYYKSGHSYSS